MIRLILAALLPVLGVWAHAHPRLAVLAAAAVIALAVAAVKALRDFGPPLAVASWGAPSRGRGCPSCGFA
jgi:hypothetical protein